MNTTDHVSSVQPCLPMHSCDNYTDCLSTGKKGYAQMLREGVKPKDSGKASSSSSRPKGDSL